MYLHEEHFSRGVRKAIRTVGVNQFAKMNSLTGLGSLTPDRQTSPAQPESQQNNNLYIVSLHSVVS